MFSLFKKRFKTCFRCKQEKPHALFQRDNAASDGLRSTCRLCENKRRRERWEAQKRNMKAPPRVLNIPKILHPKKAKAPLQPKVVPIQTPENTSIKIPIRDERDQTQELLQRIADKYQAFHTLSISGDRMQYILQIHGEKRKTVKGVNLLSVLSQAAKG